MMSPRKEVLAEGVEDLIRRLEIWPATEGGGDGLNALIVGDLMKEAATALRSMAVPAELRELSDVAAPGPWWSEGTAILFEEDTREQVCCGRGYQECCGNPDIKGNYGPVQIGSMSLDCAAFAAAAANFVRSVPARGGEIACAC